MTVSCARVSDLLEHTAVLWPDSPALTDRHASVSRVELLGQALKVATALQQLGVEPGDRVALVVDKRIAVLAAMFGIYKAGAVLVPVNPLLKPRQVAHILSDSDARAILAVPERQPLLEDLATAPLMRLLLAAPDGAPTPMAGTRALGPQMPAPEGFDTPDLATLFYTSGSTGLPKAVACTHRNILAGAESVASYIGNTPDDVILAILPLSFDAGYSQITTGLISGARIVLQDYLMPNDISRACAAQGVTGITGVPAIWTAVTRARWTDEARLRMRYFANTGGHLPKDRLQELRTLFPAARPYPMYGLTEAFRSAYLPPERVDDKPGSIGKAIPGAALFVLDGTGAECAPGQAGELVHAGPTVSLGYWKNPEETARRFRPAPPALQAHGVNGTVVYSGDVVSRDADGFLYYHSRADAQIKILGNRISFREVEDTAMALPGLRACVAGGRPDPAGGDPALVLFAEGEDADGTLAARLDHRLRQELPGYTVPSVIIVVDRLQMNPNGKYDFKAMLAALDPGATPGAASGPTPGAASGA